MKIHFPLHLTPKTHMILSFGCFELSPLSTHRVGFIGSPCHRICCRFMHFRSRNPLLICNLFALHKLWIDCDFDLFVYAIIIHILNELQHTSSSCGHKPNEAKENGSFITIIVCKNNNTESKTTISSIFSSMCFVNFCLLFWLISTSSAILSSLFDFFSVQFFLFLFFFSL